MPRTYYADEVDDDFIVPDGCSLRVPVHLMDARQRQVFDAHRPRHAELTDEIRQLRAQTRSEYLATLTSAWKSPSQLQDQKPPDDDDEDNGDDDLSDDQRRKMARDQYIARTTSAWRTRLPAATGFAGSVGPRNIGAGPGNRIGGGSDSAPRRLLSKDAADAQRNAAYDEMCARQRDAWRTPR